MNAHMLLMIKVELVIGKLSRLLVKGALVTIEERKNFTVSTPVDDKSAKTVKAATITVLAPFKVLC
jgi:IS30 family transposase